MFESTLSAQGLNDGERRFGSLSVAVFGHLAIVVAIVGVTALMVPPVKGPELPPVWVGVIGHPPLDLDPPQSESPKPKKGTDGGRPNRATPQAPIEPPVETPETTPSVDDAQTPDGPDDSGDGTQGDPAGTESGARGGHGDGNGDGESGDPNGTGIEPVFITGDMVKPQRLVRVEPIYPNVARQARLGGRVVVKAVIGLDGSVESAEVFSSTSSLFDRAALDAVKGWRYRPALMNGRPVRVYFTVVVDFSVR